MAVLCEPPRLTQKGNGGRNQRLTFGVFMTGPSSSLIDRQVVANKEFGGGYCERTGVWYPASRLVVDGYGRRVGDDQLTKRPKWL